MAVASFCTSNGASLVRFRLRDTFDVAFFIGAVLGAPWGRRLIAFFHMAVFKRAPADFFFLAAIVAVRACLHVSAT